MHDMNVKFWSLGLVVAGTMLVCVGHAQAGAYTVTLLDTPQGYDSSALGINSAGQISGFASSNTAGYQAVLWSDGSAIALGAAGAVETKAIGINDAGQVAGFATSANGVNTAVVWSGATSTYVGGDGTYAARINNGGQIVGAVENAEGVMQAAQLTGGAPVILSGPNSVAFGLNDAGQAAGYILTADGFQHAAMWQNGVEIDLGTLGGDQSSAIYINGAGQVAGWAETTGSFVGMATVWSGGTATPLAILDVPNSQAFAINNAGHVVGEAGRSDFQPVAALWIGDTVVDLNAFLDADALSAGWLLVQAAGINDQDWIVGTAHNAASNLDRAFLLKPTAVPEPATCALYLLGLTAMVGVARRRKGA